MVIYPGGLNDDKVKTPKKKTTNKLLYHAQQLLELSSD